MLLDNKGQPKQFSNFSLPAIGGIIHDGDQLPEGIHRVAVQLLNFADMTAGDVWPNGLSKMAARTLRLLGYTVVQIPYHEFYTGAKIVTQVNYLHQKLKEAIKPTLSTSDSIRSVSVAKQKKPVGSDKKGQAVENVVTSEIVQEKPDGERRVPKVSIKGLFVKADNDTQATSAKEKALGVSKNKKQKKPLSDATAEKIKPRLSSTKITQSLTSAGLQTGVIENITPSETVPEKPDNERTSKVSIKGLFGRD